MLSRLWIQNVSILLCVSCASCGGKARLDSDVEDANRGFENGDWTKAEQRYLDVMAQRKKRPPRLVYNLGLTKLMMSSSTEVEEMKQKRTEEAERLLFEADTTSLDLKVRALSSYSLGHLYFTASRFQEAKEAYRNALEFDPSMTDAIHNLELTLRQLALIPEGAGKASSQGVGPVLRSALGAPGQAKLTHETSNPNKTPAGQQSSALGQHTEHRARDRQRLLDRLVRKSKKRDGIESFARLLNFGQTRLRWIGKR